VERARLPPGQGREVRRGLALPYRVGSCRGTTAAGSRLLRAARSTRPCRPLAFAVGPCEYRVAGAWLYLFVLGPVPFPCRMDAGPAGPTRAVAAGQAVLPAAGLRPGNHSGKRAAALRLQPRQLPRPSAGVPGAEAPDSFSRLGPVHAGVGIADVVPAGARH